MCKKKKPKELDQNIISQDRDKLAKSLCGITLSDLSEVELNSYIQNTYKLAASKFLGNQDRETDEILNALLSEKQDRISERQGRSTKSISVLSLIISGVALMIVLISSGLDYLGDLKWQGSQAELLIEQTALLQEIKNIISVGEE